MAKVGDAAYFLLDKTRQGQTKLKSQREYANKSKEVDGGRMFGNRSGRYGLDRLPYWRPKHWYIH